MQPTASSRKMVLEIESWPLARRFEIARGSKISAELVRVTLSENGFCGRGEAVPYRRYGESIETVSAAIETLQPQIEAGMTRAQLGEAILPGAARAAVDCALWDLQAKQSGQAVWQLAGMARPEALTTALTIVIDAPDKMARAAAKAADWPLLKIKLGGRDGFAADLTRLTELRQARPDAEMIVDVNEGWQVEELARYANRLADYNIRFFEQPVPQAQQAALAAIDLPFCADESAHESADIADLAKLYDWVNIKIDKTGGLTEALEMAATARRQGLNIMVGCMVATSLSMAPAHLVGQLADYVDLDGPLWLERDRENGLAYENGVIQPPEPALWG